MNTQTHLVLALALFSRRQQPVRNVAVAVGALLPDAPVYTLFIFGKLAGYSDAEIFGDFYWREPVRATMGAFNSFFVVAACAGVGWLFRQTTWGKAAFWFAISMALHVATDFPLHVDDGHRHFWPFSTFVFSSPVSYWDDNHYGGIVSIIEAGVGITCCVILWRRFELTWLRALCVLVIAAYIVVPAYWIWTFST